jgi:hypothetical protein
LERGINPRYKNGLLPPASVKGFRQRARGTHAKGKKNRCTLTSLGNAIFFMIQSHTKSVEYRLLMRIGKRQKAKGEINNQSLITGFSITKFDI